MAWAYSHLRAATLGRVSNLSADAARARAWALYRSLEKIVERDPEQEVRGMALPVLSTCIEQFRAASEDPIAASVRDVVSPDAIAEGEPVRAVDALLVVHQLAVALGPEHRVVAF